MSDTISRAKAIEALSTITLYKGSIPYNTAVMRIKQLPSALGTNLAEVGTDCISRQAAIDALKKDMASLDHIIKGMSANDVRLDAYVSQRNQVNYDIYTINNLPTAQPKSGQWILDRSGAYCCSECMEPCAGYVMMKPRDKFCKMCGAKMEVTT